MVSVYVSFTFTTDTRIANLVHRHYKLARINIINRIRSNHLTYFHKCYKNICSFMFYWERPSIWFIILNYLTNSVTFSFYVRTLEKCVARIFVQCEWQFQATMIHRTYKHSTPINVCDTVFFSQIGHVWPVEIDKNEATDEWILSRRLTDAINESNSFALCVFSYTKRLFANFYFISEL